MLKLKIPDHVINNFLTFLVVSALVATVMFLAVANVKAEEKPFIPDRAKLYLPSLVSALKATNFPPILPESIAGQIEQETCYSLKHRKCWNPKTELKTSREYGFGLGQLTLTDKFNGFEEVKQFKELKDWKWEDRYDPEMQIRGIIIKDRIAYNMIKWPMLNEYEKMAAMFAAYNGGVGGLIKDRKITHLKGGDTTRWFGGIELHSTKSRVPHPEYKKSFFDINREYPKNILLIRMQKYKPWMEEMK